MPEWIQFTAVLLCLLQFCTDPNEHAFSYDGFDRVQSVAAVDPSSAKLGVTQNFSYNNRSLVTELDQTYQNSAYSASATSVLRTYDGYGAAATEQTYIGGTYGNGGTLKDTWQETRNGAGRRTQLTELNHSGEPFTYGYQADGSLTATAFNSHNFSYAYGTDGLLTTRTTPFSTQSIVSRDAVGRITAETQKVNGSTVLNETLPTWRPDSTQSGYTANRTGGGGVNETRAYGYDDTAAPNTGRGHLLSESFAASSSATATNTYQFDGGMAAGLGQRTRILLSGSTLTGTNTSNYGPSTGSTANFARLQTQTLSGSLSSTNQLPATGSPVNDAYDAVGQLSSHTPGSNTDTLTWDAFGRLISMTRNPSGNGFSWSAVYDGFGRRLQTSQQTIVSGSNSGSPLVTQSSYDPDVQFLELASTVGGVREWLIHGPDITGGYGDLQGTGGVDAVVNDSTSVATGVISDIYGHTEATVSGTNVTTWNTVRSTGYGPEPGTTAQALSTYSSSNDLSAHLNWHGKYVDGTGMYYLGNRYYDPSSGTFLSADPLGHAASMDLYNYCGGDPVNRFDPDGRLGKNYIEREAGEAVGIGNFALDTVESLPEILYQGSPLALPEHFEEGYTALQNPVLAVEQRWQAVKSAYQSASQSIQSEWTSGSYGQGKILGYGGAFVGSVFIPGLDEARAGVGVEKVTSGEGILAATRGIPNTGVAHFDRLAAGTDEFNALLDRINAAGITIRPTSLPGTNPAFFQAKAGNGIFKTFYYDPTTMAHIDTLHESLHLDQILGGLRSSNEANAAAESAAYNYEAQLGLEYGFSDEYMNYLQEQISEYGNK